LKEEPIPSDSYKFPFRSETPGPGVFNTAQNWGWGFAKFSPCQEGLAGASLEEGKSKSRDWGKASKFLGDNGTIRGQGIWYLSTEVCKTLVTEPQCSFWRVLWAWCKNLKPRLTRVDSLKGGDPGVQRG